MEVLQRYANTEHIKSAGCGSFHFLMEAKLGSSTEQRSKSQGLGASKCPLHGNSFNSSANLPGFRPILTVLRVLSKDEDENGVRQAWHHKLPLHCQRAWTGVPPVSSSMMTTKDIVLASLLFNSSFSCATRIEHIESKQQECTSLRCTETSKLCECG